MAAKITPLRESQLKYRKRYWEHMGSSIEDGEAAPALSDFLGPNDKDFVNKIRLYNNALCLATWEVQGGREKIKDSWSNFKF